jgi:hypothetical protein
MKKTEDNPDMRVLKTSTCKTITGKSILGYQIGVAPDSVVHLRITKNTGAGFFNDEWIALKDIQNVLDKCPEGSPITSFLLQPLFKGKSVNSPAFMVAALTQEKLLRVLKGKKRGHELLDPEAFDAKMDRLVSSPSKTGGTAKKTVRKTPIKKSTTKKAAVKKRSVAKRKTG